MADRFAPKRYADADATVYC